MQSSFWTNTIWYILLGITTVIEIIVLIIKLKNIKLLIALFITVSGMAFSVEATIMFFFKAYYYYPMIFPHSPLDDFVVGNFFSQFSITATVILIAVYDKKYYWYFVAAGAYSLIETFFISLGIYAHNWYRTWLTFVGIIFFCWLVKKIYKKSLIGVSRKILYSYVFFSFFNVYLITLLWIFKIANIIDFNVNIFPSKIFSFSFVGILKMFVTVIPCEVIFFSRIRYRWKFIFTILLYFALYAEYKLRIIYIKQGWVFIYTTIEIFGTYLYIYMLKNFYQKSGEFIE